jgi:hypothetical protein
MAMTSSRTRKKPLTERQINKRKKGRRLHPRRFEIIHLIAAYEMLSRTEIDDLLFAETGVRNSSATFYHLKEMVENGHLNHWKGALFRGSRYTLTARGRREFGLRAFDPNINQEPMLSKENHRNAMVQSHVFLQEWAKKRGIRIAIATEFEIEMLRRNAPQQYPPRLSKIPGYGNMNKEMLTFRDPVTNVQSTPDFLVYRIDGSDEWENKPVPVEVELTAKPSLNDYKKKMRTWQRSELDDKTFGITYLFSSDRPKLGRDLKRFFSKIQVRPNAVQVMEAVGVETLQAEMAVLVS